MKSRSAKWLVLAGLAVAAGGWAIYRTVSRADTSVAGGGRIVATVHNDPHSFNRLVSPFATESELAALTGATLVRVNRTSGAVEPWLAREWTMSPDGRTWTIALRDGVTFSDGTPFTSADVLFTLRALYDPKVESALASGFLIDGKPIAARATDDTHVILTYPVPFGPGLSLFDSLPILPRARLEAALDAGTFAKAWGVTTPLSEIAGLGPFVLDAYVPGERLHLSRNKHYWRRDAAGRQLPYLDEIELQIVADQDTEIVRLESGDVDLVNDQMRPEDVARVRTLERAGRLQVVDAGVSPDVDGLWFDLAPGAPHAKDKPWLQKEELRQAISLAVDRQAIVDTVFLGDAVAAYGPVTPGVGDWYAADVPHPAHDPARAKALLASIGLVDRRHDGRLEDAAGRPARFSILTQKGQTIRERTAVMIQAQLAQVGLAVDVVPVDVASLQARWAKGDYDAMYYGDNADALDPARNLDFWMSSGSFHFWNPGQPRPATAWEATIDGLMRQIASSLDQPARRRLFAEVQRTFAAHEAVVNVAAPRVTIAMSARVKGATPSGLRPLVLWNADALSVVRAARPPRP